MFRSMLFFIVVFSISSCQQDFFNTQEEVPTHPLKGVIAEELIPYFDTFQKEASDHGLEIDYLRSDVTADFEVIDRGSVAGICTTNGHDLRHITIDQSFWNRASHLSREMIIYHELGHCVLGRGHREDKFENGICRSIMRSGLEDCRDAYSEQNRAYFVEELFENVSL